MSLHENVSKSEGVPFFNVKQPLIAGSAANPQPDNKPIPKLFQALTIRNMTIQNRIGVSPMCQGSADEKFQATPWHQVHYGTFAIRGPGITIIEATSVSKNGGLTPQDLGIFTDEQAEKLKPIVDFSHSQGQKIAIQIGHGGRKASSVPMYVHLEDVASKEIGGWGDNIVAPSAIEFRKGGTLPRPRALTIPEIKQIIKDFGSAAKRSVEISKFDAIEIHAAHGYLINEFMSEVSNKRTDEYGGSFDNRIRFLLEIIDEVRANVPKDYPVFLRFSAVENSPDNPLSWKIEDSIKLAPIVISRGIDVIDVSSGGNDSEANARGARVAIHAEFARAIKKAIGNTGLVACVGAINTATLAEEFLEEGAFDITLIGKKFLTNPGLVREWADELGVRIYNARQYEWAINTDRQQIISAIQHAKMNVEALKL